MAIGKRVSSAVRTATRRSIRFRKLLLPFDNFPNPKRNFLDVRKNSTDYIVKKEPFYIYEDTHKNKSQEIKTRSESYFVKGKTVINPIHEAVSARPHLVLYERLSEGVKVPRFAIEFEHDKENNVLTIKWIQRIRSEYVDVSPTEIKWDNERQTALVKEFQKKLGGIFPSEFLVSELIYRFGREINNGLRLVMDVDMQNELRRGIYSPIIQKFFNEVGMTFHGPSKLPSGIVRYELTRDSKKKRVREILDAK